MRERTTVASRPVFLPHTSKLFEEVMVDFKWHPGMSRSQAQKSIASLHEAARQKLQLSPLLEVSTKAPSSLGVSLSAFNLTLHCENVNAAVSVESAFQGSKIFERAGPFTDLYSESSGAAKSDTRLRDSGNLIGFNFCGENFPLNPRTAFYDWLYLNALVQNTELAQNLLEYEGFTDIAFNPIRSWNCQARSAAIFVSLSQIGTLEIAKSSKDAFIELLATAYDKHSIEEQGHLSY